MAGGLLFTFYFCNAQRGKDGVKIVSTANNIVNEYTALTADASAGATSISVANSTLNTNNRFPSPLSAGDLIMIIQIQGASILGQPWIFDPNFGDPRDSTWGGITNYNNCGNWEFAQVYSVPNGTTITLDCPLVNNYTAAGRVQVVRVPRYSSLTVNNGGSVTCDTWNGTIGGVCAVEVENNTTINAGGMIDGTGRGFSGGQLLENLATLGVGDAASIVADNGAEKGEGIAGYQGDYTPYGGRYCAGAPANGGGGGDAHNGGGGGGANGGNPLLWNGHGNPDLSVPAWVNAWNLHYSGFASQTSSGGGQGGYTFSGSNQNATVTGPSNGAWGGDQRRKWGGFGGRPLDYSTGRLFLGGGGGSGDQNDNYGGRGGNGGALIYLMNYGTVSGAGQIISNGNNGVNATGTPSFGDYAGEDAAGGGGAGGTIVVNSIGNISGIALTANGGNGGNQVFVKGAFSPSTNEAEGPGGGGGGGYIAISNGTPVRTAAGGANGTTNSDGLTEFIPNGATQGGAGTNNAAVTNFIINAPNVTICAGQSATLTATLTGTVPGGTSVVWYDSIVAGNVLGTGNTYTTPVLTAGTYTYYVGTCAGTYHQPVVVTATPAPVVSAGNDVTICSGNSTTLIASGGTSYVWTPSAGLSNPNISNPVASPVSSTTYIVTASTSCGNIDDTVIVTVSSSLSASISGSTLICAGDSVTLTASGGGNYSWSTGATTSAITDFPSVTTTYSVFVSNGSCADTASLTVTVNPAITATISGSTTICTGNSTTLTASGGTDYSWNTGDTTSSVIVSPTTTTSYTVIATAGTCSDTASVTVTVSPTPSVSVSGNTSICSGSTTTLTASGGTSFLWSTGATSSDIIVSPAANTTYSVIASTGICSDSDSVTVSVFPLPNPAISGSTTICTGNSATLAASGGNTYSWWNNGATSSAIVVSPSSTASYTVTATDTNGCSADAVAIIGVASASVSGNATLCQGQSATLTASGGNTYSWIPTGDTASSIFVSPTVSTSYTVIATAGICSDTAFIFVTVNPIPTATANSDTTIFQGETVVLSASGGAYYLWSNGATDAVISVSPSVTTVYCVTVSNAGNCSDTACVTVTVELLDCPSADGLYLPNAFSPNGDNENDELQIYFGDSLCIKSLNIVIYNRWGEKVFESDENNFKWDGMYHGKKSDTGVFVYHLKGTLKDGREIERKGNISLIR